MSLERCIEKKQTQSRKVAVPIISNKTSIEIINKAKKQENNSVSSLFPVQIVREIKDETQKIQKLNELTNQLDIENKIKEGAENLLQVFDTKTADQEGENHAILRRKIELELDASNMKIARIKMQINEIKSDNSYAKNTSNISYEQNIKNSTICYNAFQRPMHSFSRKVENTGLFLLPVALIYLTYKEYAKTIDPVQTLQSAFKRLDETINDQLQYIKCINHLILLFKSYPTLKYNLNQRALGYHLCNMFSSKNTDKVACGYRLSRYIIHNLESISFLKKIHIEYAIIRSFSKDSTASNEREQALKLLRSFYEIRGGIFKISKSVVSAIVSLAEHSGDKMSSICIETLAEMRSRNNIHRSIINIILVVLNPALIISSGGNKILLQTLSDGPFEISNELLVISNLTNIHPMMEEYKVRYCANAVATMIKSWSGLLYMSMYNMQTIRSLVDALRISSSRSRDVILDLLYNIFRIQSSSITSTFLAGRRLTTWGRPFPHPQQELQNENVFSKFVESGKSDLSKQFLALIVIVFVDIGILDALMAVAEDSKDKLIFRKATLLIVELLQLINRILPLKYGAKLQFLPKLFVSALEFDNKFHPAATSALLQIESLNRAKMKISFIQQKVHYSDSENFLRKGRRQLEQIKLKLGLQIDDIRFRTLLLDTQILSTKNYKKWRWDILVELLQGPLLNPKRLEESIRSTKFMKRLLSFYRPFSYRFSNIKQTKPNQRYVRIGRMVFTTLLANPEGVRYLADSKLLRQISECLAQLDPISGISCSYPLFSKQRLEETLTSGYFVFLGTLSENKEGIAMMEKLKIFNMFYHLTELRSRDDLILNFITNMDYRFQGHPRIILSKALTTGLKDVRLFVTKHLGTLLSPNKKISIKNTKVSEWAIYLLVTQLYDPSIEVCQMAVKVLEKACYDFENLQYTLRLRPTLEHLGDIGAPLRLRFLASSIGFNYLREEQNESYVNYVENRLSSTFLFTDNNDFDGLIPPHFYGEIIKTSEGCQLLKNKGHFEHFVSYVFNHKNEYEDKNVILQLKSSLWAIGNIGSHNNGFPFLENSGVIPEIVYIAEKSQVISLRGYFHSFLEPWHYQSCSSDSDEDTFKLVFKNDIQASILKTVIDLSSHVLANKAVKSLSKLKLNYPEEFKSLDLYKSVLKILTRYRYRQPVRKFILEMFSCDLFYQNCEMFLYNNNT
ncbi:hypothetical protein PMAC_003145 [Pneumocystis sp. 'macacae']|nr:hypothetical protein PMAC_003145 [Pneumocystis sp. 'macacae']